MRLVGTAGTLVVLLTIAGALRAQDQARPGEGRHKPHAPALSLIPGLDKLTLTDEQKGKLKDLQKEYAPQMAEFGKKRQAILTDEQIKARHDAEQEAKAAGKSRKEAAAAGEAAMKLTDEQKAKMGELQKESQPLRQEIREKVLAILTPEQQDQLKAMLGGGHKPKKPDDNK